MTSDSARRYLVAYDISDDGRRGRVAKALESYGDRIQYSVFLVDAKPAKLLRMKAAIRSRMDVNVDSILICDLGYSRRRGLENLQFIGVERSFTGGGPIIF